MLQPRAPLYTARRAKLPLLLAAAAVVLCVFVLRAARHSGEKSAAGEPLQKQRQAAGLQPPALQAAAASSKWPKVKTIRGLETLWQVPEGKPKGVLFVAHGCSHQGSDFWLPSPRCRHCLGLPEELRVTEMALRRGYAVVAVSSYNRDGDKCWQNRAPSKSEDLKRLPGILKDVMKDEGLEKATLYAFGASSGGGIAMRLAQLMSEVKGVICQINPVNPFVFDVPEGRRYPPIIFVHMAQRDPQKARMVSNALAILKDTGVPGAEIQVDPRPLTPKLLQRAPQVSAKVAEAVVQALRKGGYLDEGGYFVKDPRSGAYLWRELLKPVVGGLSLEPDVSQVAELFNLAFARHEIISDTTDVCLSWLEAGGKKKVEDLQRRR